MSVEETLEAYFLVKRKMRELKYEEDFLKDRIHTLMNESGTNELVTPRFKAQRRLQIRENISRTSVPPDVWDRYAMPSSFTVLHITPS